MNTAVTYTEKFRNTADEIAKRFFLPAEFAKKPPDNASRDLLHSFAGLDAKKLESRAFKLTGKQCEQLLLIAGDDLSDDELATLYKLIEIRASHRLIVLFWACFQYHHRDVRYLKIAKILVNGAPKSDEDSPEAAGLALSVGSEGPSRLADKLMDQQIFISTFIQKERLCDASPFCDEMTTAFFKKCSAAGFLLNEKKFTQLLFERSGQMPDDIVSNYLDALTETQYFFDVNNMMLERWGNPYSSADWQEISSELKRKFVNWTSYRKLVMHIKKNKLKIKILADYIPHIRDIHLYRDNRVMVMDFGDFVVVDDCETSPFSYYLSAETYTKIRERIEADEMPDIRREKEKIPHGRDFIIEEMESDFMQLDYEDVGRLYIRDMLDIVLGIKPDLRPSKLLIKNKKNKNKLRYTS